ncbi:low molecular weight phosphatase family protein [Microbacterium atlanticum]|uniref:arsenate reductase/protein-tyrosine-phosphatase family protein n=1 Tax=Microbacterium atlanticum TaxID=2782168 RepID=UPI001887DDC0|nr:low molecular weight phosphatase family protein [Microbacterium atlanticum]
MFEILTVCTGNVCRSPLAEQLLRARLADLAPHVTSAGIRGLTDVAMTAEAQEIAVALGVPADEASAHRSRFLLEQHLETPDLILTMARDHRRAVAELAPSRLRSTFTVREFARLAGAIDPAELRKAADAAGEAPSLRLRAVAATVASYRGLVPPADDPDGDDVIDPYRRSWQTYLASTAQLEPAVRATAETIRLAVLR